MIFKLTFYQIDAPRATQAKRLLHDMDKISADYENLYETVRPKLEDLKLVEMRSSIILVVCGTKKLVL